MTIQTTTIYTRDRIIRCRDYVTLSKKTLWIIFAIFTFVEIFLSILAHVGGYYDNIHTFALVLVATVDLTVIFMWFIVPRLTVKKAPFLNAETHYTFEQEQFSVKREIQGSSSEGTFKYSSLARVMKNKDDVYLFVSTLQCYVLDISELTPEQIQFIKGALEKALDVKKIKWK